MLTAAQKIRDLEDKLEDEETSLTKAKSALQEATADSDNYRNEALLQETAAGKATREVGALKEQLSAKQKEASSSEAKANSLASAVEDLRKEAEGKDDEFRERVRESQAWQQQAENLQHSLTQQASELQTETKQNQALNERVQELSEQTSQADLLANQIVALKRQAAEKDATIVQLKQRSESLDGLKDRYSEQLDEETKTEKTWHAKVDQLQSQLDEKSHKLELAIEQRADALKKAKESNSHEDEYFDEYNKLQQKQE